MQNFLFWKIFFAKKIGVLEKLHLSKHVNEILPLYFVLINKIKKMLIKILKTWNQN